MTQSISLFYFGSEETLRLKDNTGLIPCPYTMAQKEGLTSGAANFHF